MAEQWDAHTGGRDSGATEPGPQVDLAKGATDPASGTPAAAAEPERSWLVLVNRRPCRVTVRACGVNVPGADGVDQLIAWESLASVPLTPYTVKVTESTGRTLEIKFGSATEQRAFQTQVDAGTASARAGHAGGTSAPASRTTVAPPRPPGPASPVPSAGPNRGVAKLIGAVAVFVVCSIIQAVGGSSMFDPSYDPSVGFVLGLLVNLTFYPGWLLTAGLVVSGIKELANRS